MNRPISYLMLTLVGAALLAGCVYLDNDLANETDKQTGDQIVAALDRYAVDHGDWPGQLELLMPTYLPALPKTSRNEDFQYRAVWWSDRFMLCFGQGARHYGCCLTQRFKEWDCTDGGA